MSNQPNREREIFNAALDLTSADARPARKSHIGSDFLRGIALDDKLRKAAATSRPGKRSADPIGEIIARVS